MQLEENMYVRTKKGNICKLIGYDEKEKAWIYMKEKEWFLLYEIMIAKASHNIIDLIEAGDYVNGNKIIKISTDHCGRNILIYGYDDGDRQVAITIYEDEIKSIVTKEQFKSMSYKV